MGKLIGNDKNGWSEEELTISSLRLRLRGIERMLDGIPEQPTASDDIRRVAKAVERLQAFPPHSWTRVTVPYAVMIRDVNPNWDHRKPLKVWSGHLNRAQAQEMAAALNRRMGELTHRLSASFEERNTIYVVESNVSVPIGDVWEPEAKDDATEFSRLVAEVERQKVS